MNSVFKTTSPEQTIDLGMQLAARLRPGMVVLLFGDLGSGKTHFTKGIAKGFGIDGIIKSPTFAYVNEYELRGGYKLYHYDLYRLNKGDSFHSIGLEETMHDPHAINVIEWADRLEGLEPKDHIRIEFKNLGEHHEITMRFHDSGIVPDTLIEKYWDDWATPVNVRQHCKQVAKVGVQIAQALNEKNILVDVNMVNTACLLHDMARVCDFINMDKALFKEEITEEKWAKWQALREQFKGMNHPEIACGALLEDGYNKTAELVRLHKSVAILDEPEKFSVLEVSLVYYADKRVKHDEIVSLEDRIADAKERYGKHNSDEAKDLYQRAADAKFMLQEQLFSLIDIKPEDVR